MPLPQGVQTNPYGPLVDFQTTNVLPPSAVYLGPNDTLFVQFLTPTVVSQSFTITYRILKADGTIATTNDVFITPPVSTFNNVFTIPPQEGFLLSFVVRGNTNVSRGQVFLRVFINTGTGAVANALSHLLMQGYVSQLDAVAFPQSPNEGSLNGRGWLRDILVSAGLGLNAVFTVPANVHWLVRAASFGLSTDAVVQNRTALVKVTDPTATVSLTVAAPGNVPANSSATFAFASGNAVVVNGQFQTTGLPDQLILPPAWAISFGAFNLDPGDQVGGAVLTVEEFVGQ